MWEEIFNVAISNGIFALLFVFLFFYQLKNSEAREKKYQNTIQALSNHLNSIENVQNDITDIKQALTSKRRKTNEVKGEI